MWSKNKQLKIAISDVAYTLISVTHADDKQHSETSSHGSS